MLAVLHNRNFAFLYLAGLISNVGTWALYTALPFYVYEQTGSALATGAMVTAQTIPRILLSAPAGVCVDRWDRKGVMIAADIVRAGLLLLIFDVHSRDQLWVIYLVAFGEAVVSQFFGPAREALVPHLVNLDELTAANALDATAGPLIRIPAPALGGGLLALLGVASLILVDSASYLVSAALILAISIAPGAARTSVAAVRSLRALVASAWTDWRDGIREVSSEPSLRSVLIVNGIVLIGYGMFRVVLVLFARDALHGDALVFGWLVTAQGIGGLVGATGVDRLERRLSPHRVIGVGLVSIGVLYLLVANLPHVVVAVALLAVTGIPITVYWISVRTLLQKRTPDALRGRVFGLSEMVNSVSTLTGVGIASLCACLLGAVSTLDLAAGFYLLGGTIALILFGGAWRHQLIGATIAEIEVGG